MLSTHIINNSNNFLNIIIYIAVLLIILTANYIVDIIDFKKFAKKYYNLDINIFRFSLLLLKMSII